MKDVCNLVSCHKYPQTDRLGDAPVERRTREKEINKQILTPVIVCVQQEKEQGGGD